MPKAAARRQHGERQARLLLRRRLEDRRLEVEQALMTRSFAIADPAEVPDPEYVAGLRMAISAALGFALESIESGEDRPPPFPVLLLSQARLAARHGIGLDTVLRRYFACYAVLVDFLIEEVERDPPVASSALKRQLRSGASIFDWLIAAIAEEYVREETRTPLSSEQLRADQVERLLGGELIEPSALNYDLDYHHVALVCSGEGAEQMLGELASALDCLRLAVRRPEGLIWAWLGRRRPWDLLELSSSLAASRPVAVTASVGEPAEGLAGWRLTHRQASAAFAVSLDERTPIVRYADVAVPATALQDDLLRLSLRQLYIEPLEQGRDRGETARETLRAYFEARGNVTSAAAILGLSRQAVSKRLRMIEGRIGRPVDECAGDLEMALLVEKLGEPATPAGPVDGTPTS